MACYRDLEPCTYFGIPGLTAVGWLDTGEDYPRGPLLAGFGDALAGLLVRPWQPVLLLGFHRCPFCRLSGGPDQVRVGDRRIDCGASNLFVPAGERLFVAPSLVLHYVDAHDYSPPTEFQRAVLACPASGSTAYLRALRATGFTPPR